MTIEWKLKLHLINDKSIEEETIMLKANCKPIQAFAVQPTFCEQL